MVKDDTALTEEQVARFRKWTESKLKQKIVCTTCGNNDWILGSHVVTPVTVGHEGGVYLGGPSYPQVMLICRNCGHTLFFNAMLTGVIGPEEEPEKEYKESAGEENG